MSYTPRHSKGESSQLTNHDFINNKHAKVENVKNKVEKDLNTKPSKYATLQIVLSVILSIITIGTLIGVIYMAYNVIASI